MRDELKSRGLRALRHRRGLRQQDLSGRAAVARSVVADLEAGRLDRHALGALRRVADAAGGWIRIDLVVAGDDVRRLLDEDHARLQSHWKESLTGHGWIVDPEVTFNHFGERGSIDLLAWHAASRTWRAVMDARSDRCPAAGRRAVPDEVARCPSQRP